MTLDHRIREDLRSAAAGVPAGYPTGLAEVKRRGLRRRRVRRGMWVTLSAVPVVLFLAVALPSDPDAFDSAGNQGVEVVHLGGLAVPVTERDPAFTEPEVWVGLSGPSPRFDTSHFGPELSFEPGEPSLVDLDDRVKQAVYLGQLEDEPFFVYSRPAPSFWDRLFEIVFGNLSGDIVGTSLSCCSGGGVDEEYGLPGVSVMTSIDEDRLIVAEWLGLSPDVSVVAHQVDGEFVGWQTPVGGVSSITLNRIPGEVVILAFNAEGDEVNRYDPSQYLGGEPTGVSGTVGSVSADFVSEGLAIEVDDLPSELQRVIELSTDDELFRVLIEGQFVYVVLSEQRGNVYAQSCSTLATGEIPQGLQATCLERIVDGRTERGTFRFPEDTG